MKLKLFAETITLCKLHDHVDLGDWLGDGPLHVLINDPHGKTVICAESFSNGRESEFVGRSCWRCFQIDEIFDIDTIGVVAEFSRLLTNEQISVFVISSYETDYLLIQPRDVERANHVFSTSGHLVESL